MLRPVLSTVLFGHLLSLEVVLRFISQVLLKKLRFSLLFATGLFFATPVALAQRSNEHAGNDNQPVAGSSEQYEQDETDLYDDAASKPEIRPSDPRDPLSDIYSARSSQAIDQRNDALSNSLVRDPLGELPRDLRDDHFIMQLAREEQQRRDRLYRENWRSRDAAAFEPLGIPVGSFVFYPELYSDLISSNNLFASKSNKKSDYGVKLTPSFRLRSDWNNHQLEVYASATNKRWRNFTSENTVDAETRLRGRIDITARTSIEGGARYELRHEGRGSSELPDAASRPAKTHESELFAQVNHRFNRLGFRLRGQVIRNVFEDVGLNSGAILNNRLRDYDEKLLSLRTNYEFSPRLSLFADGGLGQREFEHRIDGNGFLQGSKSWLTALGASVELTPTLNFLGRVGYVRVKSDDPTLDDLEGVIYDARLVWSPTRLLTATLHGETEIEETTQSGSPGSINKSVSLELANAWTHRLSSRLKGEYEVRDYEGIVQKDEELTIGLGVEYLFSRSWLLAAGYEHTRVDGSNEYREDAFRLGLKWRR